MLVSHAGIVIPQSRNSNILLVKVSILLSVKRVLAEGECLLDAD
jgi:hypothetical protein